MRVKWTKIFLIALFVCYHCIQFAIGKTHHSSTVNLSKDKYTTISSQQALTELNHIGRFKLIDDNSDSNTWQLGQYTFQCDNRVEYDCHLFFKQKSINVSLLRDSDVNGFLPYIYQSKTELQYKVILIEAEAERGTAWYYAVVFKNDDVIDAFFIDMGRRFIEPTSEFLAKYPDVDEIYISPEKFLSVFINSETVLFKFNQKYLWLDGTSHTESEYLYISRHLQEYGNPFEKNGFHK